MISVIQRYSPLLLCISWDNPLLLLHRVVETSYFWCFLIVEPFQVEKIHSNNSIPSYLIQEGREVIRLRSTLQGLMERCSHISSELETFISDLASLKSVDSLDNSRSYVLKQPTLLASTLVEYFCVSYAVRAFVWLHIGDWQCWNAISDWKYYLL